MLDILSNGMAAYCKLSNTQRSFTTSRSSACISVFPRRCSWDHMAETDTTQRCGGPVPFNFSSVLDGDELVHGSARPGAKGQRCFSSDLRVPAEDVTEWVEFMKGNGIKRVISLLSPSELETYAEPLREAMLKAFGPGHYTQVDAKTDPRAARDTVLEAIQAAVDANEKVVVHCWGGGGRTGTILAGWLSHSKGLSPEEAAGKVCAHATAAGVPRRADAESVRTFLGLPGDTGAGK